MKNNNEQGSHSILLRKIQESSFLLLLFYPVFRIILEKGLLYMRGTKGRVIMEQRTMPLVQIARVDGKNCFVEVLNRAFPIGKVSINFIKYNTGNTKGSRIESEIHAYIDWDEFLYFADLIETIDVKAAGTGNLWENLGGSLPGKAKRTDGKAESRKLALQKGSRYDFMLLAEKGAGEVNNTGLIVPKYGSTPDQRVSIPMTMKDAKKMVLAVKQHMAAYINGCYMGVYKHWNESDWKADESQSETKESAKIETPKKEAGAPAQVEQKEQKKETEEEIPGIKELYLETSVEEGEFQKQSEIFGSYMKSIIHKESSSDTIPFRIAYKGKMFSVQLSKYLTKQDIAQIKSIYHKGALSIRK